ncbi:MAG: hypothetical protein J6Y45_06595 [Bacteroidales bacterium]|nr:hypothetical protein [Bacteroidales bacterium]
MVYTIEYLQDASEATVQHPEAALVDLYQYIEHKTGMSIDDIKADSAERFKVLEEEALRDIVVMSEITGRDKIVRLGPDTLSIPECARLLGA